MRNRAAGSRRRTFSTTSRSAALARPVISPMRAGRNGSAPLAVGGEDALGGEQPLEPLERGQQFAEADQADLARPQAQRAALDVEVGTGAQHDPRPLVRPRRAATPRAQVTVSEMLASVSRSTRNWVGTPGRRRSSAIWPSTQISPSRATQRPIFCATTRTGTGSSGELSSRVRAASPPIRSKADGLPGARRRRRSCAALRGAAVLAAGRRLRGRCCVLRGGFFASRLLAGAFVALGGLRLRRLAAVGRLGGTVAASASAGRRRRTGPTPAGRRGHRRAVGSGIHHPARSARRTAAGPAARAAGPC